MFDYCLKCDTEECMYKEVIDFINIRNKENESDYQLVGCPDAIKGECTADLQYRDNKSGEIITIEVKRVLHGFGEDDKDDELIVAKMYGMFRICNIVNETLNGLSSNLFKELSKNYKIEIPASHLNARECQKFRKCFSEFILKFNIKNLNEINKFNYKRKQNIICVKFIKLSDEDKIFSQRNHNNNSILYQFPAKFSSEGGMNIDEALKEACNFNKIIENILCQLDKARNSFGGIKENRIVLCVVVMKCGMELFTDVPIYHGKKFFEVLNDWFNENREELTEIFSDFDEAYLIFSDDKITLAKII